MKVTTKTDLLDMVKTRQSISGMSSRDAFAEIVGEALEESSEVQKFNHAYLQRRFGSVTIQVDGFDMDTDRETLTIFVMDFDESDSLFNDSFVGNVEKQIEMLLTKVARTNLLQELDPSEPFLPCLEALGSFSSVHVRVFSSKEASSRLKETTPLKILGWSVQVFTSPCSSVLNTLFSEDGESIEIDFQGGFGQLIPCMQATSGENISCWLAIIPGDVLAKIFDRYGNRLLESNVRSFLQFKGRINAGIRSTIEAQPSMFFPFNNGLSATVTDIVTTSGGRSIRSVKGLQIVNGGQTTASLWRVYRDNRSARLDQVNVMAKITCIADSSVSRDMVANISRFANSQNAVSASDFFSNHPFHVAVEKVSLGELTPHHVGRTRSGWFYERTRGSHANYLAAPKRPKDITERKAMFPAAQRIDKIELAKILLTFSFKAPHLVSLGGQKAFVEFAKQMDKQWEADQFFVTSKWWQDRVAERLMFIHLSKLVFSADWYRGGIRAQVSWYTLSLLSQRLEQAGNTFNRQQIWSLQDVDGEWLVYVDRIANFVHDTLVATSKGNLVSEWTKSLECWKTLQQKAVNVRLDVPAEAKWIVDLASTRVDRKAARAESLENNKVNALVTVMQLKEEGFWLCVRDWHEKSRLLRSDEYQLVVKVSGSLVPTDKQASQLIAILERAKSIGMVTQIGSDGKHRLVS